LQCIRKLTWPVGRVDVDQYGADAGRRQLQQQPLDVVGRPDADAIALAEADTQQPAGKMPDLSGQFRIVQAALLGQRDDGPVVG
jgi:hypothetical protein